jgi:hypothetical protein
MTRCVANAKFLKVAAETFLRITVGNLWVSKLEQGVERLLQQFRPAGRVYGQ